MALRRTLQRTASWRRAPLGCAADSRARLVRRALFFALAILVTGPASAAADFGFESPTGKINCAANDRASRISCATSRPERGTCDGQPFATASVKRAGKATIDTYSCWGGIPVYPFGGRKIAYGRSVTAYGIRCVSTTAGITCRNRSKHGFTISSRTLRRF